jgi:hypothetical protein
MSAIEQWLALAPRPWALRAGQQYHVFLSYRSVHRPWVIHLYDALRHLGYSVFLDQYVLSANDSLVLKLDEGLRASASGVLMWSRFAADSEWCRREYATMVGRQAEDPDFHFVVARLDRDELPEFAGIKIYQDFSDQREGPGGSGLLKLLYGLRDLPLEESAIRFAEAVDAQTREALVAIAAAQSTGNVQALLRLAHSQAESVAWSGSALLPCRVAEALIALDRAQEALAVLTPAEQAFPRSVRPRQLKGLALRRSGDWQGAQATLAQLTTAGEMDPETMGLYAATWMDRYQAEGQLMHLRRARGLYAQAFANAPRNTYVGINAASKSVLLGELEAGAAYAAQVEQVLGSSARPGDYWATATLAEAHLLKQDYDRAAALYEAAVTDESELHASHASTWAQAQLLMDKLQTPASERAKIAKSFAHL